MQSFTTTVKSAAIKIPIAADLVMNRRRGARGSRSRRPAAPAPTRKRCQCNQRHRHPYQPGVQQRLAPELVYPGDGDQVARQSTPTEMIVAIV